MKTELSFKKMTVPIIVMLVFVTLGVEMWQTSGYIQPLFFFGYIGVVVGLGLGLGLYAALPKKHKPRARRLSLILVGSFLFVVGALLGVENSQIEGFFFGLFNGVVQMTVIHNFIAKIIGPVLFGCLWCGWACWTVLILDLLPFQCPSGRLARRFNWLRYLHFGLSLSLVLLLYLGFDYTGGAAGRTAILWCIVGNVLYYLIGIALAYALKDNRAFCKYVCPVVGPLKLTSRFSLLKIGRGTGQCNDCDACEKMCPMDIRISDYNLNKQRVLSTECSLCQTCISVSGQNALKLSFGFDLGGKELLRERSTGSPALRKEQKVIPKFLSRRGEG